MVCWGFLKHWKSQESLRCYTIRGAAHPESRGTPSPVIWAGHIQTSSQGDSLQQLLIKHGAHSGAAQTQSRHLGQYLAHPALKGALATLAFRPHKVHSVSRLQRKRLCWHKDDGAVPKEIAAPDSCCQRKADWDEKGCRPHTISIFWAHLACGLFGNHGHIPPCLVWEGKSWSTQAHL